MLEKGRERLKKIKVWAGSTGSADFRDCDPDLDGLLRGAELLRKHHVKNDELSNRLVEILRIFVKRAESLEYDEHVHALLRTARWTGASIRDIVAVLPQPTQMRSDGFAFIIEPMLGGARWSPPVEYSFDQRLRELFAENIEKEYACTWAEIGLEYPIVDSRIDRVLRDVDCRDGELIDSYARHRIWNPSEPHPQALSGLLDKLTGAESEQNDTYRQAVVKSLNRAAKSAIYADPQGKDGAQALRDRVERIMMDPATPLHHRMMYSQIRSDLDDALYFATQSVRPRAKPAP